jgi:hypothetical protein
LQECYSTVPNDCNDKGTVSSATKVYLQIQQTQQQIKTAMLGVNATFANVTQQVEQHFWIVNRNLARIHIQPPQLANLEQHQQNML